MLKRRIRNLAVMAITIILATVLTALGATGASAAMTAAGNPGHAQAVAGNIVSAARMAMPATTGAATCPGNRNWVRGTLAWDPGSAAYWRTCRGTSIEFTYQGDGNLVLYIAGKARWATNTVAIPGIEAPLDAVFQSDGNLVVYDEYVFGSHAVWASNTNGKGATRLSLQEDGNLVIYAGTKALWASHTCCWR